jgi:hypothetical protein
MALYKIAVGEIYNSDIISIYLIWLKMVWPGVHFRQYLLIFIVHANDNVGPASCNKLKF